MNNNSLIIPLLVILLLTHLSCKPIKTNQDNELIQKWKRTQNYYILYELIDKYFLSKIGSIKIKRKEILHILGKPNWGTIKQSSDTIIYQGLNRHVPYQDKAIFSFDENNYLKNIDWISE